MTHTLRADLHVHTRASNVNGNVPFLRSRDCYSSPWEVSAWRKRAAWTSSPSPTTTRSRGALELLDRLPDADDVVVGEKVSCRFPDGDLEIHLRVYETTEDDRNSQFAADHVNSWPARSVMRR
jgi:hypothetical protein